VTALVHLQKLTRFFPIRTLKERIPKTLSPSTSGISWDRWWRKYIQISLNRLSTKLYETYCKYLSGARIPGAWIWINQKLMHTKKSLQYLGKGYNNGEKAHEACYKPQRPCHNCCSSEYRGLLTKAKEQVHPSFPQSYVPSMPYEHN
jgi:hypothetical protein